MWSLPRPFVALCGNTDLTQPKEEAAMEWT